MEAKKKRGLSARHAVGLGHSLNQMSEFVLSGRLTPGKSGITHRNSVGATMGEGPSRAHAGRGARVSK